MELSSGLGAQFWTLEFGLAQWTWFGPRSLFQVLRGSVWGLELGLVPNVVIQNYPDLSTEMKVGHKKTLFGESYLIRTHFLVNFWPKMTKIGPIFVCFGSY